ncbi:MAG TPA: YicC/YloC family endoribonuclease [Gemmatimonadaceae bacterium]|nr:YicC/YloC family endoribonuclease [Gemmatimonadaceae bacterium]
MIRSMTGFGAATGRVGTQQVTVELRTVNHRFFNPSIKLPSSLSRWEGEVREVLRRGIARGHVTLTARVERDARTPVSVDEARFATYVELIRALQARHGLGEALDVGTVLRLPDVLSADGGEDGAGSVEELTAVVQEALGALTTMRAAEGERLAALLASRIDTVEEALERIAARAPERLVAERERLRKNVRELADGVDLDPVRLAQEIAVLADRLDVAEEVDRFRSHLTAFRGTLRAAAGEQVGKRLAFLLQEMLREANTTGSKARDAEMLHHVVAVKEELERIAEQVENVE